MSSAIITAVGNIFGGAFETSNVGQLERSRRNADDQSGTTARKLAGVLPVVALFVIVAIIIVKK